MAAQSLDLLSPGDEVPTFELDDPTGRTVALEDFRDHEAVLVVFTCNHCPYAKAKHPELNAIAAEYDEVAVVGINANDPEEYPDDSPDEMRTRMESGEIDFDAYLFDESQSVAAAYGATCTPDPFLCVNDGNTFRLAYHGRVDDAHDPETEPNRLELREAIDAVLAGDDVPFDPQPSRGCSIKWKPGNEPDYWDEL